MLLQNQKSAAKNFAAADLEIGTKITVLTCD
jgi:hypothetical protein